MWIYFVDEIVGITAIEIENADDRKHALSPFLPSPNGTFNGFFE
jgi:hypothetical protein